MLLQELVRPSAPPPAGPVPRPAPRKETRKPLSLKLDPRKRYDVTIQTNCGSFSIRLDVRHAPHTTASFVHLARTGFFHRTIFHRIVPGFVIQGGDPTQTGAGGPGYSTVDRPPAGTRYSRYTVAMAKTQAEPPGTAGSQFFVVTGANVQHRRITGCSGRSTWGAGSSTWSAASATRPRSCRRA